jgi:hypothetical protein
MRSDWTRHAARMMAASGGSLEDQVARAREYAAAEAVHNPRLRSTDQISVPSSVTGDPVMAMAAAAATAAAEPAPEPEQQQQPVLSRPYRDPAWEQAERAYMDLSIANLNALTRSYNLMAPDLAKKPYFSLQRELNACFADVAPRLPDEIRQRATRPRSAGLTWPAPEKKAGGILGQFSGKDTVRVHVEAQEKAYGLKEWWRDFWKK